jgi:hypothetical protein
MVVTAHQTPSQVERPLACEEAAADEQEGDACESRPDVELASGGELLIDERRKVSPQRLQVGAPAVGLLADGVLERPAALLELACLADEERELLVERGIFGDSLGGDPPVWSR